MNSEAGMNRDKDRHGRFILFNLAWFAAAMLLGLAYVYSPLARSMAFPDHWYYRFLLLYLPFLAVQTLLHWLFLSRFFAERGRWNLLWAVLMPVLLAVGFALALYLSLYLGPWPT